MFAYFCIFCSTCCFSDKSISNKRRKQKTSSPCRACESDLRTEEGSSTPLDFPDGFFATATPGLCWWFSINLSVSYCSFCFVPDVLEFLVICLILGLTKGFLGDFFKASQANSGNSDFLCLAFEMGQKSKPSLGLRIAFWSLGWLPLLGVVPLGTIGRFNWQPLLKMKKEFL